MSQRISEEGAKLGGAPSPSRVATNRSDRPDPGQPHESLYADLLENAQDLVQSSGPDGSLLYVNRAWQTTLGYHPQEVLGASVFDFIHPDSEAHCRSALQRVLAGENIQGIEIILVTKDGRPIPFEGTIAPRLAGGGVVGTVGVLRDLRQRRRMEAALRDSEEKLRALLESASQGIVLLDGEGHIELVNARIEEMFGYRREELLGKTIEVLIPDRHRGQHAQECASYYRKPHVRMMGAALDLSGQRKDGSEFPVDVSLSYLRSGEETLVLSFVSDITEQKQSQEALRRYSESLAEMVEARTAELRHAQAQLLSQQRLQQELELAEQVQSSLLPRQVPSLEGFDFAAMALPARYVSGDLYDFICPAHDACHIVLADIAGKGVPAALLTSTARALLRAEVEHEASPERILMNVNSSLFEDLAHAEVFITVFLALLEPRSGRLTYANAGHTEALWWHFASQTCCPLKATGLPLGILPASRIGVESVVLRPGDTVVFYSDGITEATNAEQELFGFERLARLVREHANEGAAELAEKIIAAVEAFRGDHPRSDDVTLVVLDALSRNISFEVPATLGELHELMALVREAAKPYGSGFAYEMELAASEIVTNVIHHAYREAAGEIRGQLHLQPAGIELDLYDTGLSFDPRVVPEPDPEHPHEGGYGLAIARLLTDDLVYTPSTPDGNHWRLVKSAGADPEAGSAPRDDLSGQITPET